MAEIVHYPGRYPGKIYLGTKPGREGVLVCQRGTYRLLDLRLDLANHSPGGFAWGYEGSGCAQLALAILADALQDDARALAIYQHFKSAILAKLAGDSPFNLTYDPIALAVARMEDLAAVEARKTREARR